MGSKVKFFSIGVGAVIVGALAVGVYLVVGRSNGERMPTPLPVVVAVERKCEVDGKAMTGGWYGACRPNSLTKRFDRLDVTVRDADGRLYTDTVSPQTEVNVGDAWTRPTQPWVFDLEYQCSWADQRVVIGAGCFLDHNRNVLDKAVTRSWYRVTIRRPDGSLSGEDFALPAPPPHPQVGGPWPPR